MSPTLLVDQDEPKLSSVPCCKPAAPAQYILDGERIDSLDLKRLVVTRGVTVHQAVYDRFCPTHRLTRHPRQYNWMLFPDNTPATLHDMAHCAGYYSMAKVCSEDLETPFSLGLSSDGRALLWYHDQCLTEVHFPPKTRTRFYDQKTSTGKSFLGNAVISDTNIGHQNVIFAYLWPCELARAGFACQFCHPGADTRLRTERNEPDLPTLTPTEVGEICRFALVEEPSVRGVLLTSGTTLHPQGECRRYLPFLQEIRRVVPPANMPEGIRAIITPPTDPSEVDPMVDAGVTEVYCNIEVWDEKLARTITPGKMKFIGRERYVRTLTHVAKKFGPNIAFTSLIAGLEPVESLLAGADYMAERGVNTFVTFLFRHSKMNKIAVQDLDYYRRMRDGLEAIRQKWGLSPVKICPCSAQ